MSDFILLNEDFSDFPIGEFPYDKNHSAMGEYHFIHYPGYYGKWYDPVSPTYFSYAYKRRQILARLYYNCKCPYVYYQMG